MNDERTYLLKTVEYARQNVEESRGGPFSALIVKDDTIISVATNLVTTNNDPTAHAEIVAIREACRELDTFELRGSTIFSSCEPCPMCLGAIYWARIDALYYAASRDDAAKAGFDDSFVYDQFDLIPSERSLMTRQILLEERIQPFQAWIESETKRNY